MASVREIARLVGVSPATVSRAMNNHPTVAADVRQRVIAAVNQAGYVSLVGKRSTDNIAFVYTGASSLGSPYDAAVMARRGPRPPGGPPLLAGPWPTGATDERDCPPRSVSW